MGTTGTEIPGGPTEIAMDVTKPFIYAHFPSKADLMMATTE